MKKKVYIICLASGKSSRFGNVRDNKLVCKFHGKKLAFYAIDSALEAAKTLVDVEVILVTRFEDIIAKYDQKAVIVSCEESRKGISYTIKAGINKALELGVDDNTFLMFLACDQPYLKSETIRNLIVNTLNTKIKTPIGVVTYNEELCNPVMFHSSYIGELMELKEDIGGKRVAKRHMDNVVPTNAEQKEVIDIDYVSDMEK